MTGMSSLIGYTRLHVPHLSAAPFFTSVTLVLQTGQARISSSSLSTAMRRSYQIARGALIASIVLAAACAPKPLALPSGAGSPFAAAEDALAQATAACRDVRSASAELGLSGRVGAAKLRGRAIVGLAAPDRIRLEAVAPFGPPVFILVSRDGRAALLLPRDDRILDGEAPEDIVAALAGIRLDPASLRAALAGCGIEPSRAIAGRAYGDAWAAIDMDGDRTIFLRRDREEGAWTVRGAETRALTITYDELAGARPARLTIRARASGVPAELRLRVSQLEIDPDLGDPVFAIDVPAGAAPLTLGELRAAGPLGERRR